MTEAMQAFVVDVMGKAFVEPPTPHLRACYDDSSVTMPLIFILSSGCDPNKVKRCVSIKCTYTSSWTSIVACVYGILDKHSPSYSQGRVLLRSVGTMESQMNATCTTPACA